MIMSNERLKDCILRRVHFSSTVCFHCVEFEVDKRQLVTCIKKTILNHVKVNSF